MSARANVCVFSIICRCIQIAILYCTIGTKNNRVAIVFPPVSRRKVSCNKQPNRFCRASRAAACHVRYGWSSIASSPSLLDRRAAMLPDSDISGIQQMTALPLFLSLSYSFFSPSFDIAVALIPPSPLHLLIQCLFDRQPQRRFAPWTRAHYILRTISDNSIII